jgi:uncharacterized protein
VFFFDRSRNPRHPSPQVAGGLTLTRVYSVDCTSYTPRVEFEWDPEKDHINQEKHGISFAEALTVFGDPLACTVPDPRHSIDEYRYLTTGYTSSQRLVIVAHTDRGERTRLITARDVKPKERRFYEQQA